mmetsp:Transcript_50430/g.162290  ORF Transcript_50430/g.162290 Transcript_50430/m.162290 type:complete len:258 (-) Transcript_50430:4-777(-)
MVDGQCGARSPRPLCGDDRGARPGRASRGGAVCGECCRGLDGACHGSALHSCASHLPPAQHRRIRVLLLARAGRDKRLRGARQWLPRAGRLRQRRRPTHNLWRAASRQRQRRLVRRWVRRIQFVELGPRLPPLCRGAGPHGVESRRWRHGRRLVVWRARAARADDGHLAAADALQPDPARARGRAAPRRLRRIWWLWPPSDVLLSDGLHASPLRAQDWRSGAVATVCGGHTGACILQAWSRGFMRAERRGGFRVYSK